MGVNGTMESCRRCGRTIFLKHVGTGTADGGWTKWDNFEPLPDDWSKILNVGVLCPECVKIFRTTMIDFFGPENTPKHFLE